MSNWIKFTHNNLEAFGIISGSEVNVYDGDMFDNPSKTDEKFDLKDVIIKNPCEPSKMIALWNNYQSLANEKGLSKPKNPLYLNKAISCIIEQGESIIRPKNYDESIFYENTVKNLFYPSVNYKEFKKYKDNYYKTFNNFPSEMTILAYDALGLIYYVWKKNGKINSVNDFSFKGKIKGKIGTFSFNNKKIIQDLNIYKAENNQFKKF